MLFPDPAATCKNSGSVSDPFYLKHIWSLLKKNTYRRSIHRTFYEKNFTGSFIYPDPEPLIPDPGKKFRNQPDSHNQHYSAFSLCYIISDRAHAGQVCFWRQRGALGVRRHQQRLLRASGGLAGTMQVSKCEGGQQPVLLASCLILVCWDSSPASGWL